MTRLILAVSDGAWGALAVLGAALVAALGGLAVAIVQARAARLAIHEQAQRIGTPNGHGNLVEMMERLLSGQTGQDSRLAIIESRQVRQAERLQAIEDTQQTFCASVHGIEVAVNAQE